MIGFAIFLLIGLSSLIVWGLWYEFVKPGRDRLREEAAQRYPVTYAVHKVLGGWKVTVDGGSGWNIETFTVTRARRNDAMRAAKQIVARKREALYIERGKL